MFAVENRVIALCAGLCRRDRRSSPATGPARRGLPDPGRHAAFDRRGDRRSPASLDPAGGRAPVWTTSVVAVGSCSIR